MPDGAGPLERGRIGPNALLQLAPVCDAVLGRAARERLFAGAGVPHLPSGAGMIDEGEAARVHQALRREFPVEAPAILAAAGRGTGAYILAHRIPKPAQAVLRLLPAGLAAPVLAKAIGAHAWTFAGSGEFRQAGRRPLVFEIADNPVVRGEAAEGPVCVWHAAVFETLFRALVSRRARAVETACCAAGAPACRFEIRWDRARPRTS